jgi:hypothetical protein
MNHAQIVFVGLWGGVGLAAAVAGLFAIIVRKRAFEETRWLWPWGIFVWGDAPVIGVFWSGISVASWWYGDWNLFGLLSSLFWVVRTFGETGYWLNQQFSTLERNPPEKLWGYGWWSNDSIWFVYQITHQIILVFALLGVIYFGHQWLEAMV